MTATNGYMGKLLFVDLTNGKIQEEALDPTIARQYVGGYGIGARIIMERMKPGVDPLGPDNIFGVGTGPFTGTGVVATCRFTTMGKSPLTGYWGDANSGGNFANTLRGSGYDAVFFEGRSDHPVYLKISDGRATLMDARHLWGRTTTTTDELIRKDNSDPRLKIISIGSGGEKLSRIAAVINDGGRAAARSGLGAVMGSKNLKAVACGGTAKPAVFDKQKIQEMVKAMLKEAKANPSGMFSSISQTGTPGAMVPHMADHDVPIKNWGGDNVTDFPEAKWAKVGWDAMAEYVEKKYACTGCPIACGSLLKVPGGKYPVSRSHKPEYETLSAFGPMCLNDDMSSLIYANELCNLHGLDTISAGATVAFAIECYENGLLTKVDTDGIELTWGNADAIISVLKKMCVREGIGDLLADGVQVAARKIGGGAEKFAMHAGGELLPMHDPRRFPGWGATYVSDPAPGRHVRGGTAFAENGHVNELVYNALGIPTKMDVYNPAGKGGYHAVIGGWQHWVNTSGACLFAVDALPFPFLDFMNAITGWELDWEEVKQTGLRISTLLHGFNVREGFKPADFTLPARVDGKTSFSAGKLKDVTIDVEGLKKQYYDAMGFDFTTGAIADERIKELGLGGILS